ncbi:NAD(P)H-hydrate dehydratase [Sulfurimonas sp.]|nr:NAD(P)H-hydrate dehydratase [Sulfurimonas sp.]
MQNLFDDLGSLDKRCYKDYGLSEDILMEHAANGMNRYIRDNFAQASNVIVVAGGGNNGADVIALARLLHVDYKVSIYYAKKPSSKMAILQHKRVLKLGIKECRKLESCEVLVDGLVGTGFQGELSSELHSLLKKMNSLKAHKIACDVPSAYKFLADVTITMGALKKSMYLDAHKDYVGNIKVVDLGVSRDLYEKKSNWKLLDIDDLDLPNRNKDDSHKGSFGHLALALGEKSGAGIISALSAFRFGTGLVTLVGFRDIEIPHSIMSSHILPKSTSALALGMGLGDEFSKEKLSKFLNNKLPLVADADIFRNAQIFDILKRKNLVLTPHPKEFISLLKLTKLAKISVEELQANRFKYVEMFCKKFFHVTLLLKGTNVIIGKGEEFYINPHGSSVLAKGGSGDVLSGLVGALLAQGYSPLEATINASLSHTKLAQNYNGADFSLTPDDLIDGICRL